MTTEDPFYQHRPSNIPTNEGLGNTYLVLGVLAAVFLFTTATLVVSYWNIQDKDIAAEEAAAKLAQNPLGASEQLGYNAAVNEYITSTTTFPGIVISGVTSYAADKWVKRDYCFNTSPGDC